MLKRYLKLFKKEESEQKLMIEQKSIGYKIREANGKYKVPVQLILGKNEV